MATDRTPVANITPFGLRMQPHLKAKVEDAARNNNRSLNSEIIQRLEESFNSWPKINLPDWMQELANTYPDEELLVFENRVQAYAMNLAMKIFKDANDQVKDLYYKIMDMSQMVDPIFHKNIKNKGFLFIKEFVDALPEDKKKEGRKFF